MEFWYKVSDFNISSNSSVNLNRIEEYKGHDGTNNATFTIIGCKGGPFNVRFWTDNPDLNKKFSDLLKENHIYSVVNRPWGEGDSASYSLNWKSHPKVVEKFVSAVNQTLPFSEEMQQRLNDIIFHTETVEPISGISPDIANVTENTPETEVSGLPSKHTPSSDEHEAYP